MKYYVMCMREMISGPHATEAAAENDKESRKNEKRYEMMFVVEAINPKEAHRAADATLANIERDALFRRM